MTAFQSKRAVLKAITAALASSGILSMARPALAAEKLRIGFQKSSTLLILLRRNGTLGWVRVMLRKIVTPAGGEVIQCGFTDITEQINHRRSQ